MRTILSLILAAGICLTPGLASAASQEAKKEPVARVCLTGPANAIRVDSGKGTPFIDVSNFLGSGGTSKSMCCGSCDPGPDGACYNCASMSSFTAGCAGVIKSCPTKEQEHIDLDGTGTCKPPSPT